MIVLTVMLLSGLLAMIRGFMREILSIAAWGAAALTTLYAYQKLLPTAKSYFNNDTVATIAVIAGVFIVTLIVVSIVTVRISDMILDSRIGALDRTLGFLFGLARGLLGQIPHGAARNRRLADGPLAGRPRKHHLEEVQEIQAGRGADRCRSRQPLWGCAGE